MWTTFDDWQLRQLQRLATLEPQRVEALMNYLYGVEPKLLNDLAIAAVEAGDLTLEQGAAVTGMHPEDVADYAQRWTEKSMHPDMLVVFDPEKGTALCAESRIPVWEIVATQRRLGTVAELTERFPSIPASELMAAVDYAARHPEEIEAEIERYESLRRRTSEEYPFVR
jgi:uncharacterized protein (DUF433 family)